MYAAVILPLHLQGRFSYKVPDHLLNKVVPGIRVVVHFGSKRFYSGIVAELSNQAPEGDMEIKEITDVLDEAPVVTDSQLLFWTWMAGYYMCSEGEVMNAALPAGLKMESNTQYVIHPDFNDDFSQLSDEEYMIAEAALKAQHLQPSDIQAISGRTGVQKLIKSLVDKKVLYPVEELEERYSPKKIKILTLSAEYAGEGVLNALMVKLEKKSQAQYKALLQFFHLARGSGEVSQTALNQAAGSSAVTALLRKHVLQLSEKTISRIQSIHSEHFTGMPVLSISQNCALDQLRKNMRVEHPVLLHGVTGSGKTEIYIHLIHDALMNGKQVLYLLPEIALTAFMVERLKMSIQHDLFVYHSRFNPQEKVEIWQSLLQKDKPMLVVGARSALFLPFSNLGLIIVDEEHDTSYKQKDPAPRYHARDAVVMLAKMNQIPLVLGSATPSLETWYNAKAGSYALVSLHERFGDAHPPLIKLIDIRKATFQKKMIGPLSPELFEASKAAIENKRQVILFQNRRGYSTWIECQQCGWTPGCRNCDVSMTYHKNIELLKCHYCGFTDKIPKVCPSCGASQIVMKGMGTQRIEDEIGILFGSSQVARMDMDTTRGKKAMDGIFKGFDEGRFRVLVGTQMITKGLDFDRVDVVGILNGDNMVGFPDFRAHEHAFQTMMQVAGRAGRRDNCGKVFIQVYHSDNPVVQFVANDDCEGFLNHELASRKQFLYPPFVRLIRLSVLHKDKEVTVRASRLLVDKLRVFIGEKQLLGPEFPPVPRVKNFFIRNILVKLPRNNALSVQKIQINSEIKNLLTDPECRGIRVIADIDPV